MTYFLTESLDDALRFSSFWEAQNAAEQICYDIPELMTANTDVAEHGDKWLAVVTRDGEDFDHFITGARK